MLLVVVLLLLPAYARADRTITQILSREHPAFIPAKARLTLGRDGRVYVASVGNNECYILRLERDGTNRFGGSVVYALGNATANKDGVIATANGHFAHKVTLYDAKLRPTGEMADFLNNDQVGWSAPPHVEAGESGDFYALDHARDRVVRISPAGKQLKAYAIPRRPEGDHGRAWDFRVCEKHERFLILPQSGPLYGVTFDGKVLWTLDASSVPSVRWGDVVNSGGFDMDEEGNVYLIGPRSSEVIVLDRDARQANSVKLTGGGPVDPESAACDLRVHGDEILLRHRHPIELFRVYHRRTGEHRRTVSALHERIDATLSDKPWIAGDKTPLRIDMTVTKQPQWRVRVRSLDEADDRELTWKDGLVDVPGDMGGVYLLTISPEVRTWHGGTPSEYLLRTYVEFRRRNAHGTLSLWTKDRRSRYASCETIPGQARLQGSAAKAMDVKLQLLSLDTNAVIASQTERLVPGTTLNVPIAAGAMLPPGRYLWTADAPELTVAAQPLVIGSASGCVDPEFHFVQYGDYGPTWPQADAHELPSVVAGHLERSRKLGFNLFVDRLGFPMQFGALQPARRDADLSRLLKSSDPDAVAVEKLEPPMTLAPTLGAYGAAGMRQMSILMGNDAGLPLGTGFDKRKLPELEKVIVDQTTMLGPFRAFRGWSWSSNWWVFDQRGSAAAENEAEKRDYENALKAARETGRWAEVLDRVSERRWSFARDAQAAFAAALKQAPARPWPLTTASAAPYRNVESYPPISLGNVAETDLQAQWEQIALPYASAHNADFYGSRHEAWMHPEIWNDSGTGEQIIPTSFMGLMRGVKGIGCSGAVPPWAPRPRDSRNGHAGIASVYRALGAMTRDYGPWLSTLENNDKVALIVSRRMLAIDDWTNIYGTYFARVLEAYCSCLYAGHPASIVFVEDLGHRKQLARYKALLVVGQRVPLEREFIDEITQVMRAGTKVFCDRTCRPEMVKDYTPLDLAFDQFEKDPSPAGDDAAYERFASYCKKHVPVLQKALDAAVDRALKVDDPEILFSERVQGQGRFLFLVNNTTPELSPGAMWRTSLLCATRVPRTVRVELADGEHVYDVFAGRKVELANKSFLADLRDLHGRIYAVLPVPIAGVWIATVNKASVGGRFGWSAGVIDKSGQAIPASLPLRVRLRLGDRILREMTTSTEVTKERSFWNCPLVEPGISLQLEVTELITGLTSTRQFEVAADPALPAPAPFNPRTSMPTITPGAGASSDNRRSADFIPSETLFGPHLRDLAVSRDGKRAYANAFNHDRNLYALDLDEGKLLWSRRIGHWFTFAPQALDDGLAIQGFDYSTSAGYHLHRLDTHGQAVRRFALYGIPGRLPHRFVPSILRDRINNFATPEDGSYVATCGDLGLAVWDRDGELLWKRGGVGPMLPAAFDSSTLLTCDGVRLSAVEARAGKDRWSLTLAAAGETKAVRAAGKTIAVLATTDGGRIFVVQDGKLVQTIPTAGDDLALSPDGGSVAVIDGRQLKLFCNGILVWTMPGDDTLHHPRIAEDGRVACASEIGTLFVVSPQGKLLLDRDMQALCVPAFLPGGDLLAASWMGRATRLERDTWKVKWSVLLRGEPTDLRGHAIPRDDTPTTRIAGWGDALDEPLDLKDNLLSPQTCRLEFRSTRQHTQFVGEPAALVDGKPDAPKQPWLGWTDVGWFAEGTVHNAIVLDTFRTRLRVEAITLVEDPEHPESWLRDARLEYWDPARERWELALRLLSDRAVHSHKLPTPCEASRWRIVPRDLSGNLRLGEIALHGAAVGPSHPDVLAQRPVAVLFDESDELQEDGMISAHFGLQFMFDGAASGGRWLRIEAGKSNAPPWKPPFGHVLPDWDFEIVEKPEPGQYRWLEFSARALSAKTLGWVLRLDGDGYGKSVSCYAGAYKKEDDAIDTKVAEAPSTEWKMYRVDLWDVFKKPVRIQGIRLGATGGDAGFDAVRLLRCAE